MSDFHAQATRDEAAHQRLNVLEPRVAKLEVDRAVGEERFKHIQTSLDRIQSSTSKVVWIVLTAILGGIMAFIINGGLNGGQ
ncbi:MULTISPECIES: hypothetical protein [Rhodovulum]|uniref:Hemolysin XhlA n=2 Tax=Rhodovulum TaxID=34008 RepID=A0A844BRV4_9RHOB|nr:MULTISPECIES: hypothetical protein [Rhodovulum]MRH22667.1 hypothetical protein [Rhodovulum strictum]TCM84796.1 hypothetical protein EV216_110114 [Rhodovulum steppense]